MKIDRSDWGRLRVTGADRLRFLQGLTTVNVQALAAGAHAWGAILTPKGRVVSVIDVAGAGDHLVITCEPQIAEKTQATLEKYAVMDEVVFEPMTGPVHQVWDAPKDAWVAAFVDGAGEVGASEAAVEAMRIRAGFLKYGADVDEDHFPFETPLAGMLDYGKGCYIGQEPVFRVHSQGNTAKTLRGISIAGTGPLGSVELKAGALGKVGEVTSHVVEGDATIGLAYVHRKAWEPGVTFEVDGRVATVHELPW